MVLFRKRLRLVLVVLLHAFPFWWDSCLNWRILGDHFVSKSRLINSGQPAPSVHPVRWRCVSLGRRFVATFLFLFLLALQFGLYGSVPSGQMTQCRRRLSVSVCVCVCVSTGPAVCTASPRDTEQRQQGCNRTRKVIGTSSSRRKWY